MEKIVKFIKKIPAYIVLVPLFLGILVNLLLHSTMSASAFASYEDTVKLISNILLMILVFGICAQMDFKKIGEPFKRGGILLAFKFITAGLLGAIVWWLAGPAGILGISVIAIVAALSNNNNAIYAGLGKKYGEKNDVLSIMLLVLCNSPAFTLIFLASGGANIPILEMLIPFIPMILGITVGNLWPKARPTLYKVAGSALPIFCLLLGTTISLTQALKGGAQGLLLGLVAIILGIGAFFLSRLYMGKGKYSPVAVGTGTVASNAILVPSFIAALPGVTAAVVTDYAKDATIQIAGAVVLTSFLIPIIISQLFKWEQKRREKLGLDLIITTDEEAMKLEDKK